MALLPVQHLPIILALKGGGFAFFRSEDTHGAAFITLGNTPGGHFPHFLFHPLAAVHGCSAFEHTRVAFDVRHSAFGSREVVTIQCGIPVNTVSIAEALGSVIGLRSFFIKDQQVVVVDIGIVFNFLAVAIHDSSTGFFVSFEILAHIDCQEA